MAVNIRRRSLRRRRRRLKTLIFCMLSITSVFFFLHSGIFSLQAVEVQGNLRVPEEEVLRLAAVEPGLNLWQMDVGAVAERVKAHPLIKEVRVERRWPHTLMITLREREALALLPAGGAFWVVDGQGYVMERISSLRQRQLPVVSGVDLKEDPGPGLCLQEEGLRAALAVLQGLPPQERRQVMEIDAGEAENLVLYLQGQVKVKFGDSSSVGEKWQRLKEALQGVGPVESLEYIDVSFSGPPVIKARQD
ncbi:MAG: Cell division protein FtsQ [Moorella sp. 60_41]|nr:MAG: Cell division protein FtsQ [Moorella sp. 60_41]